MKASKLLTLVDIAKPLDIDCEVRVMLRDANFMLAHDIFDVISVRSDEDEFERIVVLEIKRR